MAEPVGTPDTHITEDALDIEGHAAVLAGFAIVARDRQWSDDRIREAIGGALNEWLAGRTVVELPEPDGADRDGDPQWTVSDDEDTITAYVGDIDGNPALQVGGDFWSVAYAEQFGCALLAAAREARRLADGSQVGDQR